MLGEYLMLWDIVFFIISTFFRIDGFWLYNVKNTDLNKYLADYNRSMFRTISETHWVVAKTHCMIFFLRKLS